MIDISNQYSIIFHSQGLADNTKLFHNYVRRIVAKELIPQPLIINRGRVISCNTISTRNFIGGNWTLIDKEFLFQISPL